MAVVENGMTAQEIEFNLEGVSKSAVIALHRPVRKIGFLGDSITNRSSADISNRAYPDQLLEMLGAGVAPFGGGSVLSGHPGMKAGQIADFLVSDIILAGVEHLVTLQGTNDVVQNTPVATYATNMLNQFEIARKAGLGITVLTIPPSGTNAAFTADQNKLLDSYNAWLRIIAPRYGNLIDVRAALQDPASGFNRLRPIYDSNDGIHPNSLGHWVIANEIAKVLRTTFKRQRIIDGFSSLNLVSNPYFFASSASGWYNVVAATGDAPTFSFVSDTSGELNQGVWREMDFVPGAVDGARSYATSVSSGFSAGDVMAFTGKLQVEDPNGVWKTIGPGIGAARVALEVFAGSSGIASGATRIGYGLGYQSSTNVYDYAAAWRKFTVPSGVTNIEVRLSMSVPAGQRLKARIGEIGYINLTTSGLTIID